MRSKTHKSVEFNMSPIVCSTGEKKEKERDRVESFPSNLMNESIKLRKLSHNGHEYKKSYDCF